MLGTTEGFKLSIPNPVLKIADNIFRLTNKNISPTEVASFLMRKLELGRDRDSILLAQEACDYIMFSDGFIVDLPAYESTPLFRQLYTENIKLIVECFDLLRPYTIDSYFNGIVDQQMLFYRTRLNVVY
jgi:hypothetical protein